MTAAAMESEQIYINNPTNNVIRDQHLQKTMDAVAAEDTAIYAEKIIFIMNEHLINATEIERAAKTLANDKERIANELEQIANDNEETVINAPNTEIDISNWKNSTGGKTKKITNKRQHKKTHKKRYTRSR